MCGGGLVNRMRDSVLLDTLVVFVLDCGCECRCQCGCIDGAWTVVEWLGKVVYGCGVCRCQSGSTFAAVFILHMWLPATHGDALARFTTCKHPARPSTRKASIHVSSAHGKAFILAHGRIFTGSILVSNHNHAHQAAASVRAHHLHQHSPPVNERSLCCTNCLERSLHTP